jgi:hypothetical protein
MPMKSFVRETKLVDATITQPVDLQYRRKENLGVLVSGTFTSNGNSPDINVDNFSSVRFWVRVTAASGTSPTLAIHIEGKYEQTGEYETLVSRTGITATGSYLIGQVDNLVFRFIRIRWVVGGTSPSFTFTVTGQAMV